MNDRLEVRVKLTDLLQLGVRLTINGKFTGCEVIPTVTVDEEAGKVENETERTSHIISTVNVFVTAATVG